MTVSPGSATTIACPGGRHPPTYASRSRSRRARRLPRRSSSRRSRGRRPRRMACRRPRRRPPVRRRLAGDGPAGSRPVGRRMSRGPSSPGRGPCPACRSWSRCPACWRCWGSSWRAWPSRPPRRWRCCPRRPGPPPRSSRRCSWGCWPTRPVAGPWCCRASSPSASNRLRVSLRFDPRPSRRSSGAAELRSLASARGEGGHLIRARDALGRYLASHPIGHAGDGRAWSRLGVSAEVLDGLGRRRGELLSPRRLAADEGGRPGDWLRSFEEGFLARSTRRPGGGSRSMPGGPSRRRRPRRTRASTRW